MTVGSPPSSTATHEFVVPRSIPIVLAMNAVPPSLFDCRLRKSKPLYSRSDRRSDSRLGAVPGIGCSRGELSTEARGDARGGWARSGRHRACRCAPDVAPDRLGE